jgi:hypothetical protein
MRETTLCRSTSLGSGARRQGASGTIGSGGVPFPKFLATVLQPALLRLSAILCRTLLLPEPRCLCNLQGRGSSGRCDWTAAILWCTCRCCRVGLP